MQPYELLFGITETNNFNVALTGGGGSGTQSQAISEEERRGKAGQSLRRKKFPHSFVCPPPLVAIIDLAFA
jgi:hypothetical protein